MKTYDETIESIFAKGDDIMDKYVKKCGKWEKCNDTPNKVKCSECGYKHKWVVTICPKCGADMRGEEND